MRNLFNDDVMSLDTYIMFKLKEETAKLTPELKAKNRTPISLAMGAPTANPPKMIIQRLKEILDEDWRNNLWMTIFPLEGEYYVDRDTFCSTEKPQHKCTGQCASCTNH